MKKITYSLAIIFALSLSASNIYGQNFGLKAGLNLTNIGGDAQGTEARAAFHAGLFFDYKINDVLGIQPELVFSSQGAQSEADNDLKFLYNYVNIPVMLKYYLADNFAIHFGPQYSILVGAKVKFNDEDEDIKDQLNGSDFGLGFGGGYENETIQLGFRYNLGLSNTADGDTGEDTFTNQVIQVSLGFKFR